MFALAKFKKDRRICHSMGKRIDPYYRNLLATLLGIIIFYVIGMVYWQPIRDFLLNYSWFSYIYRLVMSEIAKKSVLGLSLLTFLGSLFFIGFPGELVFLAYVRAGYNIYYIAFIMLFFGMVAQVINYSFGFFLEKKLLDRYVRDNRRDFLKSLKRYDNMFILLINLLPLPADILTVLLGMVRYDFRKSMFFSMLGKILKFVFLAILLLLLKISIA
jgi:membrane protein YqaA with SNARE-associated domain